MDHVLGADDYLYPDAMSFYLNFLQEKKIRMLLILSVRNVYLWMKRENFEDLGSSLSMGAIH